MIAALSGLLPVVHRVTTDTVLLVSAALGFVWTAVNFYHYFPLAQQAAEAGSDRLQRAFGGDSTGDDRPPLGDEERAWPSITVLLPAYEESGVIGESIRSVFAAAYPRDRLEVLVITEPDDHATRGSLAPLATGYPFEVLVVPSAYPGEPNKPRALNYGLERATGSIVGVVDAEVVLGADVLREAASALTDGADFALGRLDMANEDDGWLNLLFRAEYGYWYQEVVPAFADVGYPVPLGGTSCFFRREALESASSWRYETVGAPWSADERRWLSRHGFGGPMPWSPGNVTEDFELGLSLWANDHRFTYLDGLTREESPPTLDGWMGQRIRWNKGKLYTFSKFHAHGPRSLRKRFHLYWQSLLPHAGPLNVLGVIVVLWLVNMIGAYEARAVRAVLALGLAFVVGVAGLYARGYWMVSEKPTLTRLRRAAIVSTTVVFYWFLQWIADVHAVAKTYRGRLEWEKTAHFGRARPSEAARRSSSDGLLPGDPRPRRHAAGAPAETKGDTDQVLDTHRLVLLGVILVVGTALRAGLLTRWSLWTDELYTIANRGAMPVSQLLIVPADPHPPVYYLIVHGWMAVAGQSQLAVGILSVAFSAGTILLTYRFARYLYDDRTGLLAAGLVAVSAMHIHFGRTARMYALFTFLALASWDAFVRLRDGGRRRDLVYLVATTGLLYTHVYGVFVVLAQHAYVVLAGAPRDFARRWARLGIATGVLFSPWAAVVGAQLSGVLGPDITIDWLPPMSTALLRDTLLAYAGYPSFYPILGGSTPIRAVAVLVAFVFSFGVVLAVIGVRPAASNTGTGFRYSLSDSRPAGLLITFLVVSIALPAAVSALVIPIYQPRFVIVASLPLYVLVARAFVNLRGFPRGRAALAAIVVLGVAVTGVGYSTADSVEDWRGMVNGVETEVEPGDLLVLQPGWIDTNVEYYYDGPSVEIHRLPASNAVTAGDRTALADRASGHRGVWLVRYRAEPADGVLGALRAEFEPVSTRQDGVIEIHHFRPA